MYLGLGFLFVEKSGYYRGRWSRLREIKVSRWEEGNVGANYYVHRAGHVICNAHEFRTRDVRFFRP